MDTEEIGRETVEEGTEAAAQRFRAVTLLRWLELKGLALDHGKLERAYPEGGWWLATGEEPVGPIPFRQVLEHVVAVGGATRIAHESVADSEDALWREIVYSPLWLQPLPARLWTVGFWVTLALIGYGAMHFVVPFKAQLFVDIAYWAAIAAFAVWRFLVGRRTNDRAEPLAPREDTGEPGDSSVA